MAVTFNEMDWDESTRYFQAYFATVDTLNTAMHKFESLAQKSTDPAEFSKYAAKALQMSGDLELLKNKRRAFLANKSAITPPSDAIVAQTVALSTKVANIAATTAAVKNLIKVASDALKKFESIQSDD